MRKLFIPIVLAGALLTACSPAPRPLEYGSDMCHSCKMTIVDAQHGAEAVTDKGKVYKFDAIECLVDYLAAHDESGYSFLLVNDYLSPGELIDAGPGFYLISEAIPSPMGAFLSAFSNEKEARKMQEAKGGKIFDWDSMKKELAEKGFIRFSQNH